MEYRFCVANWKNGYKEVICRSNSLDECYDVALQRWTNVDSEGRCEIEDTYTNDCFDISIIGAYYADEEE